MDAVGIQYFESENFGLGQGERFAIDFDKAFTSLEKRDPLELLGSRGDRGG